MPFNGLFQGVAMHAMTRGVSRAARVSARCCALFAGALVVAALAGCAAPAPAPSGLVHDGSLGSDSASSDAAAATRAGADAAGESAAGAPAAADAQPLAITETGWWAKDGFVHYGIMVENPNDDAVARGTIVHVTCYDAEGTITWEQDDEIALVGPGQTIGFAGDAGDGWQPARVEFSLSEGSTAWEPADGFAEPFTIESFEDTDKLYFRYEVTGQIANHTGDYASTADLSIILRDDAGAIIAGYTGSAYRMKADRTKDFLVTLQSAPAHASCAVYAQPVEG